eukprot:sb/3477904/
MNEVSDNHKGERGREEDGERGRALKRKEKGSNQQIPIHFAYYNSNIVYSSLTKEREKSAKSYTPTHTKTHVYINSHSTTPSFNVSFSVHLQPVKIRRDTSCRIN